VILKKQITIKEIAKIAETSVSTVAKSLKDSNEISIATKKKILDLALKYNYRPNQVARSLRLSKSTVIGMLIPDNSNLYYARLLRGAEDIARENNFSIVIGNTGENSEHEKEQLNAMLELRVAGLLTTPIKEDNYYSLDIPFVFLSRTNLDEFSKNINYSINNDIKGAYLAAEYLIKQGKKSIFFVSGPSDISIARQRTEGMKKALEKYNLEFKQENILYNYITVDEGYEALKSIAKKYPPPFGIFCSSDNLAIGVLAAAREKNYHITNDIGIVGYDDINIIKYLDYPLTTIRQDIYQIGAQGAKILIDILKEKPRDNLLKQVIFEPELIVRKT
jgi:LacI family transcriptional regulator